MVRGSLNRALRSAAFAAAVGSAAVACSTKGDADAARRASDQATAEAELRAQEASVTSAPMEGNDAALSSSAEGARQTTGEGVAAFRFEEADFRGRLQHSLDQL